ELGRAARWFQARVTTGHIALRAVWALIAFVILFYGFFVAVLYEGVRRLDRSSRFGSGVHWMAAVVVFLALASFFYAIDEDAPASARVASTPTPSISSTLVPSP